MSSGDTPQPISLPAHLYMPPDGLAFDYTAYVPLPAPAPANGAVVQFTVPEGFHGVIKRVGNVFVGAGWTEGSGSLVWEILANGGVIRNYDNILASLGAVSNPAETAGILIYEQQVVTLQVFNVNLAVGGAQAGGRLSGWFYPKWRAIEDGIW